MWRVLCVDDDSTIAQQAADFFTQWKGSPLGQFEASTEVNFGRASERLRSERFDLVTLDLHAEADPPPEKGPGGDPAQQGQGVLQELRQTRFVPVIFYTGYAEKIASLESLVVRVVKKGENDLEQVRRAATSLFGTGLPKLIRQIEEDQRSYVWDTVDKHSANFVSEGGTEELLYLLARRIAARLHRDSIREALGHAGKTSRPIEQYIFPALPGELGTGYILGPDGDGTYWVVATPACDLALRKAERVLLIAARGLTGDSRFAAWLKHRWTPNNGEPPAGAGAAYNKLVQLLKNNAEQRLRFLPGTFFIPDLLVDFQSLRHVTPEEANAMKVVCALDSPYGEELQIQLSKYYGRIGTPDLDVTAVLQRLIRL